MSDVNKNSPVGGVDRREGIDYISLQNAVEMSYSDLKIITDLIDLARKSKES